MRIGTIAKLAAVLMSCAAIGAAAAAVGSASSPSTTAAAAKGHRGTPRLLRGHPGLKRAAFAVRRAVHAEAVVPRADGSFATLTFDRGKVQSVSGQELKITEGTAKATYKTVTLTIPANARVRVNGARAALSDVKAGQRVQVAQTPKATLVVARGAG
jgi:hypothetical protein